MPRLVQRDRLEQLYLLGVLGVLQAPLVLGLPRLRGADADRRGGEWQRGLPSEHEVVTVAPGGELVGDQDAPQHPRERHGALPGVASSAPARPPCRPSRAPHGSRRPRSRHRTSGAPAARRGAARHRTHTPTAHGRPPVARRSGPAPSGRSATRSRRPVPCGSLIPAIGSTVTPLSPSSIASRKITRSGSRLLRIEDGACPSRCQPLNSSRIPARSTCATGRCPRLGSRWLSSASW